MRFGIFLAAGAAVVSLANATAPVQAAVISTPTQIVNFPLQLTDFSNRAGVFDLFDSNLGRLLSVNMRNTYQENSEVTVQNTGISASSGNVRTESDLTLNAVDSDQDAVIQSLLPTLAAFGARRNYTLAAGSQVSGLVSNSPTVSSGLQSATDPSQIAAFAAAGGGTGTILASTFTVSLIGNTGGNTSAQQTTYGTAAFFINYTYDDSIIPPPAPPVPAPPAAVPEPTSLLILGAGLMGLGLIRRRSA